MSLSIETINRGVADEFGFTASFTHEVKLGTMPSISLEQFSKYGSEALIDVFKKTDPRNRAKISDNIKVTWRKYMDFKVTEHDLPVSTPETQQELSYGSFTYNESPFTVGDNTVGIGEEYVLTHTNFADFVLYGLSGGLFGWNQKFGIPRNAINGIVKLQEHIESSK